MPCLRRYRAVFALILGLLSVQQAWPAPAHDEMVVWVLGLSAGMRAALRRFEEETHQKLVVSIYGSGMDPQKLMCGIAGGSPPDVIYQDRFAVGGWAARDAFLKLDTYVANSKFIHPADYYPACWQEASYQGHVYAIPVGTDNRALYYNKDLLIRAGYKDANGEAVPPRTWDDLREYAKRLSEFSKDDRLTRCGFIPNFGNSWLYFYGWQNGGQFMSPDGRKCTLADPRIVKALDFMTQIYDDLGGAEGVNAFQSGFETSENDPFLTGKVVMKIDGNWALQSIATYAPDLNFGVAPAPVPKGMPYISWAGGFSWAIPTGARDPKRAWQFIEWFSKPETYALIDDVDRRYNISRGQPFVPTLNANRVVTQQAMARHITGNEMLSANLRDSFRVFVDLLPVSKFRPVTPVGQKLWDEHARAFDNATHHVYKPQEALERGQEAVQQELDRVLQQGRGVPLNWTWPLVISGLLLIVPPGLFVLRERRRRSRSGDAEARAGLAFASPWFIGFLAFTIGPIIVSIVFSFCDYDVLHAPRYIGLANYKELLCVSAGHAADGKLAISASDPVFWKSLWNTIYMMIGVPLGMAVGLGIALLLNVKVGGMSLYRTVFYLPAIVPAVASSILWLWVLNPESGAVNLILGALGLGRPPWLTDPAWAKPSIILMGLWGAGSGMIIWLAGLQGIPVSLYEAARIDGAGAWRCFRHVTLPMLSPYIFFNLIMGIIGTLQIFTQAFIITQGGPVDSTLFYVYNLFNHAFRYFRMGTASAMAWILFLVILMLTLIQLKLAPRWVHYESGDEA
jgi:ABC-type sugar transport system permease subunit/ABC-type glycerol-3-phosphate transport system substrate-binding protein